jgi:glycosyltransferase involved in cell wall biosynthesis
MSKTPAISLVMSVRNGGGHLVGALKSLLGQTFQDFEVLISDDGSTDSTADTLDSIASMDCRFRIYRRRTSIGLTENLNLLLPECRGRLIGRMDADDLSSPQRLQRQIERLAEDRSTDVVGGWIRVVDSAGTAVQERRFPDSDSWIKAQLKRGVNVLCHGSLVFRREILQRVGCPVWRFRYGQDFDLNLRLMRWGRFGIVQEVLYSWRQHDASMCAEVSEQRRQLNALILETWKQEQKGRSAEKWRSDEAVILTSTVDRSAGARIEGDRWRAFREAVSSGDADAARKALAAPFAKKSSEQRAKVLRGLMLTPFGIGATFARVLTSARSAMDPRSKYILKCEQKYPANSADST